MKIIKLQAENIKRLKAIEIIPEGPVIKITGKNAAGKTTVLDAIWWALGGSKAIQEEPIRRGEQHGMIRLELDDLVITRTFTPGQTYLRVENKQGAGFKSPQSMLDQLVGKLSFDPLAFSRADAKTQRDLLLQVTGLEVDGEELQRISGTAIAVDGADPLEAINRCYREVFENRTHVNRQLDAAKKILGNMPDVGPVESVSVADLVTRYHEVQSIIRAAEDHNRQEKALWNGVSEAEDHVKALEAELAEARQALVAVRSRAEKWGIREVPDVSVLEAELANAEEKNQQAQAFQARQKQTAQVESLRREADGYSGRLAAITAYKETLVAKAQFPVEGLGFSPNGVTYQGVPFNQASSAQKLQVSLAMAMALNPTLRVIRIDDASLLDKDHLRIIEDMATAHDMQCWMEMVDDSGQVGVYIEDGSIVPPAGRTQQN